LGPIFFQQNVLVYFSYLLMFAIWFWLFRTGGGLALRAIGERPEAAYARGANVQALRYGYTFLGGALVGLAGAAYSLNVKPGWSSPPAMQGDGWIALAIVIFGGWHPFRVVLGAYLFAALRAVSTNIQTNGLFIFGQEISFPFVLLNTLPWLLMILTLLMVSGGFTERLLQYMPRPVQRRLRAFLRSDPPKALGTRFAMEGGAWAESTKRKNAGFGAWLYVSFGGRTKSFWLRVMTHMKTRCSIDPSAAGSSLANADRGPSDARCWK